MCTTPQDILVPAGGIDTDQGHKTYAEVADGITTAIDSLVAADPVRGVEVLGAISGDDTLHRIDEARGTGEVLRDSQALDHPAYPEATVRTPLVVRQPAAGEAVYAREWFGPISFLVETGSTAESLDLFARVGAARGGLTAGVYATDPAVLDAAEQAALAAGVHLSRNLTGGVYVNQSAAFSDYHATGANPAASASFTDGAFVANRFRIVQSRQHA